MKRFTLILVAMTAIVPRPVSTQPPVVASRQLQLVEATVLELQSALRSHLITSEQLVQMYLNRIAAYDHAGPMLNSFLHINEHALDEARARDFDRRHGRAHGPLFGIPVLLKDNIDTAGMPTTAGSVALAGSTPPDDAFITQKLHEAGAIIMRSPTKPTSQPLAFALLSPLPATVQRC
jgi:amidase